MKQQEKDILRRLGEQIVAVGSLPVQQEKKALWRALNALRPVRPMVLIDELPWHEMDIGGELKAQCSDPLAVMIETELRRKLFQWKYFPADMVIEPEINVYLPIYGLDYGMTIREETLATDERNDVVSHNYLDQLRDERDLEKITLNELRVDEEGFARTLEIYHDVFDGVAPLHVVKGQVFGHFIDEIVMWHGAENLLYDVVDRPEFVHALMRRMTDASLHYLDQLEALHLYEERQDYIHCSAAFYDWPAENMAEIGSAANAWTFGTSQIFASVSAEMHEEFELPYLSEFFSRFGMVYYGCCEPLHNKMDMVRKYPHVRKVSVSPWADAAIAAKNIHGDFVVSNKPNPARVAVPFSAELVRSELASVRDVCEEYGCPLEYILKDISTVQNDPKRIIEWERCAMSVALERNK